jgi:hypothetical protein
VGIRYYFTRASFGKRSGGAGRVWGYWIPCLARRSKKTGKIEPTIMAQLGFKIVDCGQDGPRAWAIAESWNAKWDEAFACHRSGEAPNKLGKIEKVFPPGSLGDGFSRFRTTTSWKKKPAGTRADWMRGWGYIEPIFGDVAPSTVSFEDVDDWYWAQHAAIGVRESHRGLKIWRALWRIVGRLRTAGGDRYCNPKDDPSLAIRRETPAPRNAIWMEGEAVRLVKRAWRLGYRGLAAGLAVAWDTSLSPVDVRTLTKAQLTGDAEGPFFSRDRTKTGESAIGTLGKRTQRLLAAYMATLPPNLLPSAPIFYTRGGQPGPKGGRPRPPAPYSKDTLGDDFRVVRAAEFGPKERRKIMDFRRSGAVEAMAGEVAPEVLAAKMANSIDQNRELQKTYLPHNATLVRLADAARAKGRARMRGEKK